MVGGLESLIGRAILIHSDSEFIPGFRVGVRWAANGHSCESGGYPPVKSSAEFHYHCLRVCVTRVVDQVPKVVQVVIDRPLPLEVGRRLQCIDRGGFSV